MQKTVLVDDLDGTEAHESVTFGIDGKNYEIDLNEGNASELRTLLARFSEVARPFQQATGKPSRKPASSKPRTTSKNGAAKKGRSNPSDREVRRWALENRVKVSTRGRVQSQVRERYLKAVS